MKRILIASSIALASSTAVAGGFIDETHVKTDYYGTLDKTLNHVQNSLDEDRSRIIANEQWDDRQEGVIRQNRGRLDENDVTNQHQDESIGSVQQQADSNTERSLGNQSAIGKLQEVDGQLSSTITNVHGDAQTANDRASQLESRADNADADRQNLYAEVSAVDRSSRQRDEDNRQYAQGVNSGSVARDEALGSRIDTTDSYAVQTRQHVANVESWSIEQFNRQGAAIESNSQAIASERNDRRNADEDLQAGIAGAMAAAAVQFDPSYDGMQMSIAGGAYRGASAAHLAIGGAVSESVFLSGGVSNDSRGHQGFNASANFKF